MKVEEVWRSFKAVVYGDINMGVAVYLDLMKFGFDLFPDLGRPLIFSGVTNNGCISTINSAEEIIKKIIEQENIGVFDRDFYDLQTWKGYRAPRFKPGYFEFNKLELEQDKGQLSIKIWRTVNDIQEDLKVVLACLIGQA